MPRCGHRHLNVQVHYAIGDIRMLCKSGDLLVFLLLLRLFLLSFSLLFEYLVFL
jgi:hypothetical protein